MSSRKKNQPNKQANDLQAEDLRRLGLAVIETEITALQQIARRVDDNFVEACRYMLDCRGRIIVIGMGKSGHIGHKIAATLASTGTPAFFVHPGEASHGDLGMITANDVVLALSNSGETDEILTIVPIISRLGVPLIALTGNPGSTLARDTTVHIDISVEKEACPMGLTPTSSTSAMLAMGDALAIALLEVRGFTEEDFARSHPGGRLGRRLLVHIKDIMHSGDDIPKVGDDATVSDALVEMTAKGLGMTAVLDGNENLVGIYTDGDVRRTLDAGVDVHTTSIQDVMTRSGKTIGPDELAAEGLHMMDTHKINALLVTDDERKLVGALNMHDLLRAGVV